MSRIRILSETLANQIAAGEVVERPASVVKELVENAIDAGASHIAVQVEGAGTRVIRVIDNGCGMDQDDALLCLERHATSKLRTADDLARLHTLGFRGEAIPSIASVARFTITTKPVAADLGCRVDVRFGTVHSVHETGCAQGTVIEVADLFANVPARRKFLKSANTELAHIDEVIRSYALIRHEIGFSYQVNGREVIDLPGGETSVERRVRQVLGDCPVLIPIAPGTEEVARAEIRVSGHLVPPDRNGGRAGRLWTFVNGRYIKDRMVNHAVFEGMQGFLSKGTRPAGVIDILLPPEGVDVNVHPTKQEVRFREGNLVHNKIVAAVWRGMETYQERLKAEIFGPPRKAAAPSSPPPARQEPPPVTRSVPAVIQTARPAAVPPGQREAAPDRAETRITAVPPPRPEEKKDANEWPGRAGNAACESREPQPLPFATRRPPQRIEACEAVDRPGGPAVAENRERPVGQVAPLPAPETGTVTAPPPVRYLGQLLDTYLLCEIEDGLVAIDQHAVQERLLYEELKRHYAAATMPSQMLMFPAMVDLVPAEIQALEEHEGELARLGLEVQSFGGDTVLIKAVPAALAHQAPAEVLRGLLARFVEGQIGPGAARLEEVLAGMACKAAIKAGHRLSEREVQHLLDRMHAAGIFSHCPHGRPVLKRFSKYDIERWFQRA